MCKTKICHCAYNGRPFLIILIINGYNITLNWKFNTAPMKNAPSAHIDRTYLVICSREMQGHVSTTFSGVGLYKVIFQSLRHGRS